MTNGKNGSGAMKAALVLAAGLACSASAGTDEQWGLGWNTGGPWRPTLVSTKPLEIDGPFVKTWDDITGDNAQAFAPPPGLFAVCWDPRTPPTEAQLAKLEAVMRTAVDEMGVKYEIGGRWSGNYVGADGVTRNYGATGTPIAMTWSLVPDGLSISGYNGEPTSNSTLFATMDAAYAAQGGRATWISRIQSCFDRWAQYIGVTYVRIAGNATNADADDGSNFDSSSGSATRGQVRIAMHPIDGSSGVLAYNFYPGTGAGGNMVLDANDSANFSGSSNSNRFFRNTIAHEHGHGLGLAHVCPIGNSKLMEPFLSTAFDTVRQDDARSGMFNYGDSSEPDGTIATSRNRGSVARGAAAVTLGVAPAPLTGTSDANAATLSLNTTTDSDFHKFTPTQTLLFNATVTPKGSTYTEGPQTSACNTGTSINTLSQHNLAIQVQDGAGNVIATASSGAVGAADALSNVFLTGGVSYYVRVYATSSTAEVQLYNLSYSSNSTAFSISASDGTSTSGVNVSWTAVTGATSYQVLRNTVNSEGTATVLATVGTNSYVDNSAVADGDYYYFVRAIQGSAPAQSFGVSDIGWERCPTDLDGVRGVDFGDFLAFFNCYDAEQSCADIDGNPGVDFGDFLVFFNGYDAGC
jgi:hypothetical protein